MDEIIQHLLEAPDGQLDATVKPLIQKWSEPPTALQVLEVLDRCVRGSLASGFTVRLLEILLTHALKQEGTTYEDVVAKATWRNVT